jgi:hypothetical protein
MSAAAKANIETLPPAWEGMDTIDASGVTRIEVTEAPARGLTESQRAKGTRLLEAWRKALSSAARQDANSGVHLSASAIELADWVSFNAESLIEPTAPSTPPPPDDTSGQAAAEPNWKRIDQITDWEAFHKNHPDCLWIFVPERGEAEFVLGHLIYWRGWKATHYCEFHGFEPKPPPPQRTRR